MNIGLICIDKYVVFADDIRETDTFPLRHITYLLLFNHLLQMIFLKDFFDENRRVNTNNKWVWVVHLFSYMYIIYVYVFTDSVAKERSESSKMWVPLDIILTINIALY